MKRLNIIFGVIISIMIFTTSISFAAEMTALTDISGDPHENAINVLTGLKLINGYEDSTFRPNEKIRRDEFVTLVMRVFGYSDIAQVSETEFSDVDKNNWAAKYVGYASEIGLVNGYPDGSFKPGNEISYDEAVKVIVSALGYRFNTQNDASFAAKYIAQANEIRLLDNVGMSSGKISRSDVAQILYNALDAKTFEVTYLQTGELSTKLGDDTVLDKLKIEKKKGTVTGVFGANLNNKGIQLKKNEVEIDGVRYITDVFNVQKMIGLDVRFYVDKDDDLGEKRIYCFEVGSKSANDIVIDASDILDNSTISKIYWKKDSKTYSKQLSKDAYILYNGYPLSSSEVSDSIFDISTGSVTLRSSDGINIDIILIESYKTYVYVKSSNDRINDLFGASFEYNLDDGRSYVFYRNGVEVEPSEYESNDILSIAQSLNGDYVKVIGVSSTFEGNIVSFSDDEYTIETENGEQVCLISYNYKRAIAESNSYAKKLEPGNSMIFHTDFMGHIAYAELITARERQKYGYLIDSKLIDDQDKLIVQIMTTDNKFKYYETKEDKIMSGLLENGSYSTRKRTVDELAEKIGTGEDARQVIEYDITDDGFLKEIYLADNTHSSDHLSKEQTFTGRYSNGLLDEYWYADENTVLFYIPNEKKYPELFKATNALDELENDSVNNMTLFDIENLHVGAMVIEPVIDTYFLPEDGNEIVVDKLNSPVMLIEDVVTTTNSDGEIYDVVRGYVGKKYVEETIPKAYSKDVFKKGMVVQYETNDLVLERAYSSDYDKMIAAYIALADLSNQNPDSFIQWNYSNIITHNAEICTSIGTVKRKDLPCVTLDVSKNGKYTEIPYILNGGSVIMVYNTAQKKVSFCEQEDISIGDTVFVRQRYNNVRELIIVK